MARSEANADQWANQDRSANPQARAIGAASVAQRKLGQRVKSAVHGRGHGQNERPSGSLSASTSDQKNPHTTAHAAV